MIEQRGPLLLTAGLGSAAIAVLHVGIIAIGAPAYRYFGAGEEMAVKADAGSLMPGILTFAIALVFAAFAAYGFAGSGRFVRLPFLRTALVCIAVVYVVRGLAAVTEGYALLGAKPSVPPRYLIFSIVSLVIGLCYAFGTFRSWRVLGPSR